MSELSPVCSVFFKSIGCRTNQEEMVALSGNLIAKGYALADEESEADIIIVNTCSVTASTESKTLRLLKTISRRAPHAKILVTGCLAQQRPADLKAIPGIEWVVGNNLKNSIDVLLAADGGIFHETFEDSGAPPELSLHPTIIAPDEQQLRRTRFPLKIQEGCNFRCTYCIVPYLRGPVRSVAAAEVEKVFRKVISRGYKEIVLTGTHIGQYDDGDGTDLVRLLERLVAIAGDYRIRLSSLDPRDCSDRLLEYITEHVKVARHLHISLQSCSREVLDAMGRPFTETEKVIEKLVKLRENYPTLGIGADLIVGFPGETDAMFRVNCETVDRLNLSYAHIFRYSRRPGTPAAEMSRQIEETLKTERANELRSMIHTMRERFLRINRFYTHRIIVEHEQPVRGVTSNYLPVEVAGAEKEHNAWLDVLLTGNVSGRYHTAEPA